jgi:hypothetical protein
MSPYGKLIKNIPRDRFIDLLKHQIIIFDKTVFFYKIPLVVKLPGGFLLI